VLDVEHNPPGIRDVYLEALNRCFPRWGGDAQFAWAFERCVGGPRADLMVLRENGELLAGSAVTYRTLTTGSRKMLVGIMTGSWTLPEARGRGCFGKIIEESVLMTTSHGGGALLAFVTQDNASYRRLRDAGSRLFPTTYVFSPEGVSIPGAALPEDPNPEAKLMEMCHATAGARSHVLYARDEWRSQFLAREGPTRVLRLGDLGWAVVETKGDFDRMQGLALEHGASVESAMGMVASDARARGKRFFSFTTDGDVAAACENIGLTSAPGFLTALTADPAAWDAGALEAPFFQSGDRM
jgi:hypothetical protein